MVVEAGFGSMAWLILGAGEVLLTKLSGHKWPTPHAFKQVEAAAPSADAKDEAQPSAQVQEPYVVNRMELRHA